jgi:hypothetical protein
MNGWQVALGLVQAVAWPAVGLVALLFFGKPLAKVIAGIAGRMELLECLQVGTLRADFSNTNKGIDSKLKAAASAAQGAQPSSVEDVMRLYGEAMVGAFMDWLEKQERYLRSRPLRRALRRQSILEASDSEKVLRWVGLEGARLVSDYAVFEHVCQALAKRGFKTDPPPAQEAFNQAREDSSELRVKLEVLEDIRRTGRLPSE